MQPLLQQILNALQALGIVVLTKLGLIDLQGQQIIGDLDLLKSQAQLTLNVLSTVEGMLGQLQQAVSAIKSGGTVDLTPVITAVNTRASATVAPSWWVVPPTPPTPPSSTANAAAVWDYQYPPGSGNIMGDQVNDSAFYVQARENVNADEYAYAKYLRLHYAYSNGDYYPPLAGPPLIDPTTILPTDANIVDWLNRTDTGGYHWQLLNTQVISYSHTNIGDEWWICDISQLEFEQYKLVGAAAVAVPPVWPGVAGVTLGTAVALDVGLTVTTPMHGCLISLTSVPVKQGYFTFDDVKSYRNVGAVAFVSDDGQEEYPQTLGFESAVYCPKTMVKATAVKVRTAAGIVGTIRPFTIP